MPSPPAPRLSIVIPAFNEAGRLGPTLEATHAFLKRQAYPWEVLVVDDGSQDGTADLVEAFLEQHPGFSLLRHPANRGKGAAVRTGMLAARGEAALFMDADLSTPLSEIPFFLDACAPAAVPPRFDVVIGSRRLRASVLEKRQPFYREGAGRVFSVLVRLLTVRGFLDTQCGFKIFSRAAVRSIFPLATIDRFGFDVELLFIAVNVFGMRVLESPVAWRNAEASTVRLFRDSAVMFLDLVRIRLNFLAGRYEARAPR